MGVADGNITPVDRLYTLLEKIQTAKYRDFRKVRVPAPARKAGAKGDEYDFLEVKGTGKIKIRNAGDFLKAELVSGDVELYVQLDLQTKKPLGDVTSNTVVYVPLVGDVETNRKEIYEAIGAVCEKRWKGGARKRPDDGEMTFLSRDGPYRNLTAHNVWRGPGNPFLELTFEGYMPKKSEMAALVDSVKEYVNLTAKPE